MEKKIKPGGRKLPEKKKGLNNPSKQLTVNSEEPTIPSQKSGFLTSRTVIDPTAKIRTYTPAPEPQPAPTGQLTSRTSTWPPAKVKSDLSITKTEVVGAKQAKRPEPFAFDSYNWQESCGLHQSLLSWHQRIADEYKKLGFGNITREIFNFISGGNLSELEKKFFDDIEKNIEKLGLTNEAIKDNMRNGTAEPFNEFKKSVNINLENILKTRAHWNNTIHFDIRNYILADGVFYFGDQEKERLKTRFETYIDSDVKKTFVGKIAEVERLILEIKEICQCNGIAPVFGFRKVWEVDLRSGNLLFNKNILNFINK